MKQTHIPILMKVSNRNILDFEQLLQSLFSLFLTFEQALIVELQIVSIRQHV